MSMHKDTVTLVAKDDEGRASLIDKSLQRAGIADALLHYNDGRDVLDFLFRRGEEARLDLGNVYPLMLDVRVPKASGAEVVRRVHSHVELKKLPVIVVTSTDELQVVEAHESESSPTKPIDHAEFVAKIRKRGRFLMVVEVPSVDEEG